MTHDHECCGGGISRRGFLQAMSVSAAGAAGIPGLIPVMAGGQTAATRVIRPAVVRGAFVYPPTKTLDEAGYYSWPGSSFDAEGRQREYAARIDAMQARLGMTITMDAAPLDTEEDAARFIEDVRAAPPDGLLLVPFKKGHWGRVTRIIEETKLPAVVLATLGVLLVDHVNEVRDAPGIYLINSFENLDAAENGLRMIRAAHRMKEARLLNLAGDMAREDIVPVLGTTVRTAPLQRFYDIYERTQIDEAVTQLARVYREGAKEIVEPVEDDITQAARAYFALKALITEEEASAVMMDCLPGLSRPHKHVPPCMGFMSLRDEGIPAGCQSDLNATLTLMLVQELFDRPGFQQNAGMDTERNLYFGAHCTSPSKMNGPGTAPEPYILRSHAEAGWGCVPRVLFTPGQPATLALYKSSEQPEMIAYSGEIVECPSMPAAGGCRTNLLMKIKEVDDVRDVKGMHQVVFYGDRARDLRQFCRLYGIRTVV